MRRIAIFAGAFDPIHQGHISVMQAILAQSKADEIILLPSSAPPYRKPSVSAKVLREMCATAIDDLEMIQIADEKPLKSGQSIIEAIYGIKQENGKAQYLYIVGADKLAGLLHWSKAQKLFKLCNFLVYPRSGYQAKEIIDFAQNFGLEAELIKMPEVEICSAMVREELLQFCDAPGMLDIQVARLIALQGLYQKPFAQMLRPYLSQRRYEHTLRVRELAVELAYEHGISMQAAAAAALLHDCAKEMKLSVMQAIAYHYQLSVSQEEVQSGALLHGKVGAALAEHKYAVRDPDVLNAIRHHTTGRAAMSALELCLFVADKAERGRKPYPGLDEIRQLMHLSLEKAAIASMRSTRKYVLDLGQKFSAVSDEAIDNLLIERV